jgi:hypothetical protein
MGERRAARVERRHVDLFDAESFGPGIGGCDPLPPITPRRPGELRRIVPAVRREHWSAQIVIVLAAITVAVVVFVIGLLVGAGSGPMVGG